MSSLVVRSERVVLPDGMRAAAIHIQDGRITAVAAHSEETSGVQFADASSGKAPTTQPARQRRAA